MRAALYARYSDDKQNPLSVQDQLIVCRRHAASRGWEVVAEFFDEAISGGAMANRPGILSALTAAARAEFEILLTEAEDRIARNLGHLAFVKDELQAVDVVLATLNTDVVDTMHVAMKGLIAEQYVVDLGRKTARGMRRNAEKGLATGGRIYGYRSSPGGAMAVVEDQAAIVRRIFAEYAAGATSREIAAGLNRDGVTGGRGGFWSASSVIGSRARANGVLRCELYAGVKVWDRMTVVKDTRTGKRHPRLKPRETWKRTPVPELAIVPPEVWQAVAARRGREEGVRPERLMRRPGIFSGLLKCGRCGASYTVYNKGRLTCAAHRAGGDAACANGRTVSRAMIERRILEVLKDRLLAPETVAVYVRAYAAAWEEEAGARDSELAALRARLGPVTRTIGRLVDEVCEGRSSAALRQRLAELETEKADLEARAAALRARSRPITFHPRLAEAYAARVASLQQRLAEITADPHAPASRELIDAARELIERIDITPAGDGFAAPVDLTLHGRLALFLENGDRRVPLSGLALVAGGGVGRSPTFVPVKLRAHLR